MKVLRQHATEGMKPYHAFIRSQRPRLDEQLEVRARNRGDAVNRFMQMFWGWKKRKGDLTNLGNVHDLMVVADPYNEVRYDKERFHCADKGHRLLPDNIIERLLAESFGELQRDPHISGAVKRTKRRRIGGFGVMVDGIKELRGRFFFRRLIQSQQSQAGVVLQARKYEEIPLRAKSLAEAKKEIQKRKLDHAPLLRTKSSPVKVIQPPIRKTESPAPTVVDDDGVLDDRKFRTRLLDFSERVIGSGSSFRNRNTGMAERHFSDGGMGSDDY